MLMGDFAKEEGKDSTPYVQQAMKVKEANIQREVLGFKDLGRLSVRVSVATCNDEHVCTACVEVSKHTYEIEKFLEEMPIPRRCESTRGCRCWINAEFN